MKWFIPSEHNYNTFLGSVFRFLQNHFQTNVNHREVHSVCTYIMESSSVIYKIITIMKIFVLKIQV